MGNSSSGWTVYEGTYFTALEMLGEATVPLFNGQLVRSTGQGDAGGGGEGSLLLDSTCLVLDMGKWMGKGMLRI